MECPAEFSVCAVWPSNSCQFQFSVIPVFSQISSRIEFAEQTERLKSLALIFSAQKPTTGLTKRRYKRSSRNDVHLRQNDNKNRLGCGELNSVVFTALFRGQPSSSTELPEQSSLSKELPPLGITSFRRFPSQAPPL
jgi:hypothetical protein